MLKVTLLHFNQYSVMILCANFMHLLSVTQKKTFTSIIGDFFRMALLRLKKKQLLIVE